MESGGTGRERRRRTSAGVRIGLALLAVATIFGIVLAVELLTAEKAPPEGSELLAAPDPVLPEEIDDYPLRPEPELAAALSDDYAARSVPVRSVEAASIRLRSSDASLLAASLDGDGAPRSFDFRTGVLRGAAGGFGIDPSKDPFRYTVRGGIAVYSTEGEPGTLYVWFFRDAFVQLFVPAAIATEADSIQRSVIAAQLRARSAGAAARG